MCLAPAPAPLFERENKKKGIPDNFTAFIRIGVNLKIN